MDTLLFGVATGIFTLAVSYITYSSYDNYTLFNDSINCFNLLEIVPSMYLSAFEYVKLNYLGIKIYLQVVESMVREKCLYEILNIYGLIEPHDDGYLITYHTGKKTHRLVYRSTMSITTIEKAYDGIRDVTDHFLSFIGPQGKFHGQVYTPRDLGYKKLSICYIFGGDRLFYEYDIIDLNPPE
jgi:hypothetical protein